VKRRHWFAILTGLAALDAWCAWGKGGITLSTAIRRTLHPETRIGYILTAAGSASFGTWLHFHISNPRKPS
jgi:hypothetical protein